MTDTRFQDLIRGKNVVFIAVKNKDYIRVTQIERLLNDNARNFEVISSEKNSPLSRMLEIKSLIRGWDFSGVDVIIAGFLPQLIWKEVMFSAGRERGNKNDVGKKHPVIVADFFLSLYDTIVLDRKLINEKNPLTAKLKRMDKRVLEDADLVLTDTRADADFFAREYSISNDKFEVLYLEADPALSQDTDTELFFENDSKENADNNHNKKSQEDHYKVLYFGTGLPLQGTDIVLEAFIKAAFEGDKKVKSSDDADSRKNTKNGMGIVFTYIGSLKHVPLRVRNTALVRKDITIIDWLSKEDLYKEIESADLCLAGHFNPDIDKADRTIPGKAFIYEAFGKKMILGDTVANHEIFVEDDRHIFVRRGSATELARCILKTITA